MCIFLSIWKHLEKCFHIKISFAIKIISCSAFCSFTKHVHYITGEAALCNDTVTEIHSEIHSGNEKKSDDDKKKKREKR